ncbi:hypothetical protein AMTRI_Chr03g146990 [Amborella trichopoda]
MGVLFFLFALTLTLSSLSSSVFGLTQDGEALLEMKRGLNDTKGLLSNWKDTDINPCNWTRISCHLHDQRVRVINLPFLRLGGTISPSIGKITRLHRLAIHENSLHGTIPAEIGNCTELRALYLRANYLEGGIPTELGRLSNLIILDLSSNSLRGSIPPSIGHLGRLRFLNLSTNFLSGEIPKTGVLGSFGNFSFIGNLDLCGPQVQRLCKGSLGFPAVLPGHVNDDEAVPPRRATSHYVNGVLIGAMSTLGLALFMLLSFLWICFLSRKGKLGKNYSNIGKKIDQDSGTKLVTFHGDLPYSSDEIIKRLESLSEADVVGSGGFGTVYKLVMGDGSAYAVKRIDRSRDKSDQMFERELEILGSIKHRNLVNLRGYCKFPTAKLLIYDYVVLGSLDYLLHERECTDQPLDWNARLRIALGSARGLAYLHQDCCPRIMHRDIKASNILLDENLEPHVSDFGLAKLLVDEEAHVTTVVAGTFGYLAPEYLHSGRATEKSDIYSFGVLILELVSGRRPTDPSFVKRGLNIVGWMNILSRENRLEEIVDKNCEDVDTDSVEAILDIARKCVDANPNDRPAMNRVLQMLEEVVMSPCPSEFYDSQSN